MSDDLGKPLTRVRVLLPGERYRIAQDKIGAGKTLTIQRVVHPFPNAIRDPYVECWMEGQLRRLPLDGRWASMEYIPE